MYPPKPLIATNLSRKAPSYFGLISGSIGLALCLGQSYKGHLDAKHERERMQEMHEQKMHYLHEFHRQQLHAKDHKIAAMEAEKRAEDAERLAGMYSEKVGGREGGGIDGLHEKGERKVETEVHESAYAQPHGSEGVGHEHVATGGQGL